MHRLSTFVLLAFATFTTLLAQTSDIVVFSEAGEKFTLVIDGDMKNEAPATRVVATGIANATPQIMVKFADASIPPMKQNGWMEAGKEYTIRIGTNKKGERVFRMQGEAPLGTASGGSKPKPTTFVDDSPVPPTTPRTPSTGSNLTGGTVTNSTTVETTRSAGEQVNMTMAVPGVSVDMNVNDGFGNGTTTHTTTTTTTTTYSSSSGHHDHHGHDHDNEDPTAPVEEIPVYHMPGYTGPVGCAYPMSDSEFEEAKASIAAKGFEDTKMTLAKQIGRDRCFTAAQVKGVMQVFGFEDSKLDFAKFAYDRTYDIGNYYKVNDAFGFESSVDELNQYIQGR